MRKTMIYLNKNNDIEIVDVLGYVYDRTDYCEVYTEEKGHFIIPDNRLFILNNEDKGE